VVAAISASGFDPSMLILELTETTLVRNILSVADRLGQLRSMGIRLAIDDFGTGYSSLAYLSQFPIDVLKIDRTFVSAIADTKKSAAVVHTLVRLGKMLGLEVTAEGIENDDQRRRLQAEDVDVGQGFLFAEPLSVEAIDKLLSLFTDAVPPAALEINHGHRSSHIKLSQ
jgi:EAL domain-containing protein (putative c-di-GMP-specific phosphodiesterase class I)